MITRKFIQTFLFTPHPNAPFVRTWVNGKARSEILKCHDRKVVGAGFTFSSFWILSYLLTYLLQPFCVLEMAGGCSHITFNGVVFDSQNLLIISLIIAIVLGYVVFKKLDYKNRKNTKIFEAANSLIFIGWIVFFVALYLAEKYRFSMY